MSARDDKKREIIERLKKSQNGEDSEISLTTESIKNITTGMDVFQLDLEKLVAAPKDWNFYFPLNNQKMTELIESILDNGLLSPIIVWEKDNEYMILSGHNRVAAYKMIYAQTGDEKYSKIYTYIKKKNEIDENEARSIIIDTNFVQRQLSTIEKTKSIVIKYSQLGRKKRNSEGKNTAAVIADQYNLTERQVYNYYKLNNLSPEFMNRLDTETLSLRAGLKLATLDGAFQNTLFKDYNEVLDNKKIMSLNVHVTEEAIINQLKNTVTDFVNISIKVPLSLEKELKEYLDSWFKNKHLI